MKSAEYLNEQFKAWQVQQPRGQDSQSWFARWLGVPDTSLSQWLNGVREPTDRNCHKIASKLGPEIYDILGLPRRMPQFSVLDFLA